jgi:hypothetical protein
MAEIIRFPGARKEHVPNADQTKNDEKLTHLLEFLTVLLKTDPRWNNEENIELRRKGLIGFKDGDLWALVNRSNTLQWREKPSYYAAVIEELKRRGLIGRKGRTE